MQVIRIKAYMKERLIRVFCCYCIRFAIRGSRTHRGKSATYLIVENHRGRLQSTPLGKLCTDASD
jgi:hypothetical protein